MRLLFFDCIAGISGDMALGALVDAGVDAGPLRDALASLPLEPFTVELEPVEAGGIRATRAIVSSGTAGVIRTYANIRALLDAADLPDQARALSHRMFRRLAQAEAAVHRKDVEQVTFHEVGAVDSIVDIVGTALGMTMLGIERSYASAVPTGMGLVKTGQGAMPIPAPAVVELLRGAPLYSRGVPVELVTPTGAAILAATVEGYGELPPMRVDAVGYGAGTRRLEFPNVLRVMVGEEVAAAEGMGGGPSLSDVLIETNVDDLSAELAGYTIERLLESGAQDAWLTPIVMKKGRPAVTISALCSQDRAEALRLLLFRETGTLGVRSSPVDKRALERGSVTVRTANGPVNVKVGYLDGHVVTVSPEYDDCSRVAREAGVPARDVFEEAVRGARGLLHDP